MISPVLKLNRIRVVHVLERLSVLHGGSTTAAFEIANSTTPQCFPKLIGPAESGVVASDRVIPLISSRFSLPWRLIAWLYKNRDSIDIVEIHNVFGPPLLLSIFYCSLVRQPYVLNPHNSLDQMDLQKRRKLKQVVGYGFLSWALTIGGHVRCATRREYQRLEKYGGKWKMSWSLYPIPVTIYPVERGYERIKELEQGAELRLLFMSRIDRKKRLEVLLSAIDMARDALSPFKLIIAGAGSAEYEAELKQKIQDLQLGAQVEWRGFVKGDVKISLLSESDVFILPSAYENFGIVVLEALACGLKPIVSAMVFIGDHLDGQQCVVVADDSEYVELLRSLRLNPSNYWTEVSAAVRACDMLKGPRGALGVIEGYNCILKNSGIGVPII